jgi:tetratricopeptide (TPR) repeat protein
MAQPHIYLAGAIDPNTGQYEKGVAAGREAIRLSPNFSPAYALTIPDYVAMNRIDEAKATHEQALERKLRNSFFALSLYEIAFLQGDAAGISIGGNAWTGSYLARGRGRYRCLLRAA